MAAVTPPLQWGEKLKHVHLRSNKGQVTMEGSFSTQLMSTERMSNSESVGLSAESAGEVAHRSNRSRKRSVVWQHFEEVPDEAKAICIHCGSKLAYHKACLLLLLLLLLLQACTLLSLHSIRGAEEDGGKEGNYEAAQQTSQVLDLFDIANLHQMPDMLSVQRPWEFDACFSM
ncbi:hypothetical protein HU200_021715 [Digitaria exilis]|uniref:BED-type domain-containing protein n=1 Tax=Digitaria exilis TaxID=1010633 RepID=A0A835KF68_9POAL|nr:hypothetical protein HU200_021715 [Digitaria exilis]